MARRSLPAILFVEDEKLHRLKLNEAVNRLQGGGLNVVADITLAASATSTVISDARISVTSFIELMPLTANAAAIMSSVWFAPVKGQVTVHHASAAHTDLNFSMLIIG